MKTEEEKSNLIEYLQDARKVQHLMKDERSIRALDVAERYIRGEASREELEKAKDEAWAAYDAVDAALAAARAAARDAARAAARAAYNAVDAANLERKNKMTITKDDALNALQKARKVQHLMKDERSIRALDVAERYIRGEASREELELAKDEARNAYDAVDADWTAHAAAWDARAAYDAVDVVWTAYIAAWDARAAYDAVDVAYAAAVDVVWTAYYAAWTAYNAVDAANLERKNKMTITKDDALNALQKARKVQHLMKDERSIRALDVAERYIRGEVSMEELQNAKDEARNAYYDVIAAVDAALAAARAAARAAYNAVE